MSHRIILDTDPGIDDALALFLAVNSPSIEILGLTTVYGNGRVETSTRNALYLLEQFGRTDIEVFQGASKPLVAPLGPVADFVHGADGLGNIEPHTERKPNDKAAAEWMVETILANPGEVTLVAIAPLTNLAQALALNKDIASQVKEVVIMGGAIHSSGNINPAAEANIYGDADAADCVFAADWPVTLMPLDATEQLCFDETTMQAVQATKAAGSEVLYQSGQFYDNFYRQRGFKGIVPHDVATIAYCLDPTLFQYSQGAIQVPTTGIARGMTILDRRDIWLHEHEWTGRRPVKVAQAVRAEALRTLYLEVARQQATTR